MFRRFVEADDFEPSPRPASLQRFWRVALESCAIRRRDHPVPFIEPVEPRLKGIGRLCQHQAGPGLLYAGKSQMKIGNAHEPRSGRGQRRPRSSQKRQRCGVERDDGRRAREARFVCERRTAPVRAAPTGNEDASVAVYGCAFS